MILIMVARPYQSQLQEWFRYKHNLNITVHADDNNGEKWYFEIINIILSEDANTHYESDYEGIFFDTFEDALEAGLFKSFDFIK